MINNYDGALVMPKNYAVVNEEEMTYVDGGVSVDWHFGYFYVYLNNSETKAVCAGWKGISKLPIPTAAKRIIKGLSAVFKSKNKGRGVKFRMSCFGSYVITGVWSR